MINAITIYEETCKKNNCPLGFHVIESKFEKINEKIKDGFSFVSFSTDFYYLFDRIESQLKRIDR